jgi:hypothetical protein
MFWHSYGGRNVMYYYPGFPTTHLYDAENFMPWAAAIHRATGWVLEPTQGIVVPGVLTIEMDHSQGSVASTWSGWAHPLNMKEPTNGLEEGEWKAWIILVHEARRYRLRLTATDGGSARLSVDDSKGVVSGPSGQPLTTQVFLTKGIHAVKVRSDTGAFNVRSVQVQ